MRQPPICNKFVAPDCEPFTECGYGINNLSRINEKELINILCYFHEQYKHHRAAHWRRKIHAMQKVLDILGLNNTTTRAGGE